MFKRFAAGAAAAFVLAGIAAVPTLSKSSSPAQLTAAGWSCPVLLGSVHCLPPGTSLKDAASPSITAVVFATTDSAATDAAFLGTEHVIRADVYERGNPRPCPQDPPLYQYTDLRTTPLGIPYYACHTYDSGF